MVTLFGAIFQTGKVKFASSCVVSLTCYDWGSRCTRPSFATPRITIMHNPHQACAWTTTMRKYRTSVNNLHACFHTCMISSDSGSVSLPGRWDRFWQSLLYFALCWRVHFTILSHLWRKLAGYMVPRRAGVMVTNASGKSSNMINLNTIISWITLNLRPLLKTDEIRRSNYIS